MSVLSFAAISSLPSYCHIYNNATSSVPMYTLRGGGGGGGGGIVGLVLINCIGSTLVCEIRPKERRVCPDLGLTLEPSLRVLYYGILH